MNRKERPTTSSRRRWSVHVLWSKAFLFSAHIRHRTANAVSSAAPLHPMGVHIHTHIHGHWGAMEIHVRCVDGRAMSVGGSRACLGQTTHSHGHGGTSTRLSQTAVRHVRFLSIPLQGVRSAAAITHAAVERYASSLNTQGTQNVGVVSGRDLVD